MKIRYKVLALILIAAGSFLAGSWVTYHGGRNKATAERKILFYVDPMNPALKSDKPGIAPCGMPLEPVYADQGAAATVGADLQASLPPGTIRISPEKQQLIGVKTAMVEKVPWSHTLRVLGRVVPDETRVYRVNVAVNCTIENVLPVTTGSLVKKDQLLATYYAPDYRTTLLVYYNLIRPGGSATAGGAAGGAAQAGINAAKQIRSRGYENYGLTGRADTGLEKEYYRQLLINFGFGETQLAEMEHSLTIPAAVEVRSPVSGFILYRNISTDLRVDRGADLFRIADLSRVWILADIFENEASYFKPGMRVKVELPYQKKILYAEVSHVLPEFDAATRTLKVRLVAENPGYAMRPDMLANVELPVNGPSAIIVPVDAVIDSGLKKTVFVDKGNGFFEPRQVETGHLLGERVEITRGLMPGEKIAVSGNFLIDSEARMQQAAYGITGKIGRDPVCGMNIDEDRARAEGNFLEYRGRTYFFCDSNDRDKFRKDPEQYLKSVSAPVAMSMDDSPDTTMKHPSHGAREAPKPRGAKAAPEMHDGMTTPGDQSPAAMPGMAAGPTKPESKTEEMAIPPPATSGIGHPQRPYPSGMAPPGAQSPATMPGMTVAPPKTEPKADEMAIPPPATSGMGHPQSPYPSGMAPPGAPAVAPAPTGKSGQILPSAPGTPGTNQMRMTPRYAPWTRTRQQPPSPTPAISPQMPSFPTPGSAAGTPMPGSPGTAPMSGSKAGEMLPSATGAPGMGSGSPSFPGPGSGDVPISGPPGTAPVPGSKTGEMLPSATGASDAKPR